MMPQTASHQALRAAPDHREERMELERLIDDALAQRVPILERDNHVWSAIRGNNALLRFLLRPLLDRALRKYWADGLARQQRAQSAASGKAVAKSALLSKPAAMPRPGLIAAQSRIAVNNAMALLDRITIDGRPLKDVSVLVARAWATRHHQHSHFVLRLTDQMPLRGKVGQYAVPDAIMAAWAASEAETNRLANHSGTTS